MKNIFHVASKLIAVLLLVITISGCFSITRHAIDISNVHGIRELYIRDAGTTNWGSNIAKNMQDIDKSKYSEKVDIKVVDNNGIVYSKDNVSFNNSDFAETGKTSEINMLGMMLLAGVSIGALYAIGQAGK